MLAWRCTKRKYAGTAFSGEGPQRSAGRWHKPGTRLVYASDSPALAVLEAIVHYGDLRTVRDLCMLVSMEIGVPMPLPPEELPQGWYAYPHLQATQEIGSRWAGQGRSLALAVPSAVVRGTTLLVNPGHPDMAAALPTMGRPEGIPFGEAGLPERPAGPAGRPLLQDA